MNTRKAKDMFSMGRTRRYRQTLFFTLVFGAFLSAFAGFVNRSYAEVTFDRYEVVTGSAKRQTILTGFLRGRATADLVVVHIDENDDRHMQMYGFDGNAWVSVLDATLHPKVLFVDVANIGGRDRLITYEPGRLNWFDPESEMERILVAVTSNFKPPRENEIPHVDVTHDVNHDGREDLVVPDRNGFWVFIQMSDGTFGDAVKIGPTTDMSRIYGADGYRYDPWSQSRVHEIDYNQDGRTDLVFWNEDRFVVHTQDERGLFARASETFTIDEAFDSDDLSSLATGDMTGRVLHSLADLNGDGIGDLVISSLEGKLISRKRSSHEVHYGEPTPDGGTAFASEVGVSFQSDDRIQLGMDLHDFDGDGQMDVILTTIEVRFLSNNPWKKWKAFWGDDIWLDLEFYREEGGLYPNEPNATRRIQLLGDSPSAPGWVPLDLVLRGGKHESRKTQVHPVLVGGFGAFTKDWRRLSEVSSKNYPPAFNRTLFIGDVTGDGRSDLLIEHTFRGLKVFAGVPGPGLFARRPQKVAVVVPNDEEYTWLVDLNKDGKQDILMHHPFTLRDKEGGRTQPLGTEPHRVTMLIAR